MTETKGNYGSTLERALETQMLQLSLPTPEREYKFFAPRRWQFDFAWPNRKLAVECEGGTWSGGRHTRGGGFEGDCEKYNAAAQLGWCVLRYTSGMINSGRAAAELEKIFDGHTYDGRGTA